MGFFEVPGQNCGKCKLADGCKSPYLTFTGAGKKKILIVVETPTIQEEEKGIIEFTPADNLFAFILKEQGINPETDCWKTVAIRCNPGKGKTIKTTEMRACAYHLKQLVKKLSPEKILVFGKTALEVLIGDKMGVTSFSKWTGWQIPDMELGATIYPIYSPGYLRASCKKLDSSEPLYKHFCQLVRDAIAHEPVKETKVLKGFHYQIDNLKKITSGVWAFDFETTGLKPHAEGHEIVCVSFSDGVNTLCIKMSEEVKTELQRIFTSPDIKLIAHNLKFEDAWAREVLGIQITNWYWDTMLAAHCIDNRSGITGLKFQTFVNFGLAGYEKEVSDFLQSDTKNANGFNKVKEAPEKPLHFYCAMDAFYTFHLFTLQYDKVPPGYFFFLEGAKELSLVESNGLCVDVDRIKSKRELLRNQIQEKKKEILQHPDIQRWQTETGKEFNYNSPIMLKFFFQSVGEKFVKQTETGADSTDRESLDGFKHPVAAMILEARAKEKLEGTFLAGLEEEQVAGVLHPFYSLGLVTSFRSSSSNPNAQNWPKRDKKSQRLIRGNFRPRPGRQLLEVDYSGIEVRISACYHKDRNMIRYIEDSSTDMHRDVAALLFKVKPEEVTKEMRYFGKNGFVFPQFYGSYYKQCAENIWKDIPGEIKAGLKSRGIRTPLQFETHVKAIEEHFWGTRFREYDAWKKKQWQEYLFKDKINSHTGFVYTGIMDRKIVSNYPIQGAAFHCLLWSLIQMNRWLRKRKKKSLIIGQIHDSMILDVVPEEKEAVKKKLRQIMCEDLLVHWDWIIVPLDIEADISAVDGNWYEMEKEDI